VHLVRISGAKASNPKYFSASFDRPTAITVGKKIFGKVGPVVAAIPALTEAPPKSTTRTLLNNFGALGRPTGTTKVLAKSRRTCLEIALKNMEKTTID
jgi:hypothetical protein